MERAAARALAIPGCCVIAALAAGLALVPWGRHPLWRHPRLNLAEAAGVRDAGEIVRLIDAGSDPNEIRQIRGGLLTEQPVRVTPLEAALTARDVEIARVLLVNGARLDPQLWFRLRCTAESDEVISFLDRWRPAGAAVSCTDPGSTR